MSNSEDQQNSQGTFVSLLSSAVVIEEYIGSPRGSLFADEETFIAKALPRRQLEFACGRTCARKALATLGLDSVSIPVGSMREPLWPKGIVGSITHSNDFFAAAVAQNTKVRAIGIDVERNALVQDSIFQEISTAEDRSHIQQLSLSLASDSPWRALLFSAKESLYKVWYPWTHCWLDFEQANIRFAPDRMQFECILNHPVAILKGFPRLLKGRYRWTEKHVFTAIEL